MVIIILANAFQKIRRDDPCTSMKQGDVQLYMEPCVLFPHTRYTEVYIMIGTPHVVLVYSHPSKPHFAAPLTLGGHSR